jgi:hypothetical protein
MTFTSLSLAPFWLGDVIMGILKDPIGCIAAWGFRIQSLPQAKTHVGHYVNAHYCCLI